MSSPPLGLLRRRSSRPAPTKASNVAAATALTEAWNVGEEAIAAIVTTLLGRKVTGTKPATRGHGLPWRTLLIQSTGCKTGNLAKKIQMLSAAEKSSGEALTFMTDRSLKTWSRRRHPP